jgi:hypothetical protein
VVLLSSDEVLAVAVCMKLGMMLFGLNWGSSAPLLAFISSFTSAVLSICANPAPGVSC